MPTGTGKTGVIAALARCIPEVESVLILAPRVALRNQLYSEINSEFFNKVGINSVNLSKKVRNFKQSIRVKEEELPESIIISTIQKLDYLRKKTPADYEKLNKSISLVIFDEEHYEPSRSWSDAIRGFTSPIIIFTATPFRNDYKLFDIDLANSFSYTFREAVDQNIIRKVEIVNCHPTDDIEHFVDDILHYYEQYFTNEHKNSAKVIIRCAKRGSIRRIANELKGRGFDCVAIHETFNATDRPWEFKHVPNPLERNEVFWIHQYKLLEGIDDPRFQMLALYQPLQNARSFVQQVGRIIRNPGKKPNQVSYVLDHSDGLHLKYWEGFQEYDNQINQLGEDGLNLAVGGEWIEQFMTAQPELTYIDGMFRSRFDIFDIDPYTEIKLPCKTNILTKSREFSLDDFVEFQIMKLEEKDCLVNTIFIDDRTVIFLFISYNNSQFLKTTSYIEDRLGIILVREYEELIAYFNSSGYTPFNQQGIGIGKAYDSKAMKKLFRKNSQSRLTNVSLLNSNLGVKSVRARTFSAASIQEIALGFDDFSQILTTVTGVSVDRIHDSERMSKRRYVGFSRGRVSESRGYVELLEYLLWVEEVYDIIKGRTHTLQVFRRYAPGDLQVPDPTPINILLDLEEVKDEFVTTGASGIGRNNDLQIEDVCVEVKNWKYTVNANGIDSEITISFDREGKRYSLHSPTIDELYISLNDPSLDLIDYLNASQSFRIIPKTKNTVYTLGQFYEPIVPVGHGRFNRDNFELGKILFPSEILRETSSEKGNVTLENGEGWEQDCLFGLIDKLGQETDLEEVFGDPKMMVCDDMDREIADFILADNEQGKEKVIFIHAKASPDFKPYSATILQDVCAQATKNIGYLNMFSDDMPPNLKRWDEPWKGPPGQVNSRIRKGEGTAEQI